MHQDYTLHQVVGGPCCPTDVIPFLLIYLECNTMPGRSIRIFLIDGVASGLRTAELGLSTIKAIVIPRASLASAINRTELQRTGVYILVGRDTDRPGVYQVYFGEGDTVLTRLSAHDRDVDKDFWEEAVVFVSKDENLTKAHGRYVESRLIRLACDAKRCTVTNGTQPPEQGKLPEADEVEMEEFIEQARLLLGTLGYDLFSPTQNLPPFSGPNLSTGETSVELTYSGDGYNATCVVDTTNGQFIVKKGSIARKNAAPSLQQSTKYLRSHLIERGVLVEEGDGLRFSQDYSFSAISPAAQVVSGQPVNGRTAWKLKGSSKTFAEWQEGQLADTE